MDALDAASYQKGEDWRGSEAAFDQRHRNAVISVPLFLFVQMPAFSRSGYSTVTDFARFRGWSTFVPRRTAM